MKTVIVSGAVILRTNPATDKKEIFAIQRGYGNSVLCRLASS